MKYSPMAVSRSTRNPFLCDRHGLHHNHLLHESRDDSRSHPTHKEPYDLSTMLIPEKSRLVICQVDEDE